MRLDKYISNMTGKSRSEVRKLIWKGEVKVNSAVSTKTDLSINPDLDEVLLGDMRIDYKPYVYIVMNKPSGVITATKDNFHKTVLELVEGFENYDITPVGRLDIDTTGLLLLTNDGDFNHKLMSPKKHMPKTYYVELEREITVSDISAFKAGLEIPAIDKEVKGHVLVNNTRNHGAEDKPRAKEFTKMLKLQPADLVKIADTVCELTIYEGKFHQVKRMFQHIGNQVLSLKRIKIGEFKLPEDLPLGEYRELTEDELSLLLS